MRVQEVILMYFMYSMKAVFPDETDQPFHADPLPQAEPDVWGSVPDPEPEHHHVENKSVFHSVYLTHLGNISSPGFPASFPREKADCLWQVDPTLDEHHHLKHGHLDGILKVHLDFLVFDLPGPDENNRCTDAYVQYGSYSPEGFKIIRSDRLCGSELPESFTCNLKLWINFVTCMSQHNDTKHKGFLITFQVVAAEEDEELNNSIVIALVIACFMIGGLVSFGYYIKKKRADQKINRDNKRRLRLSRKQSVLKQRRSYIQSLVEEQRQYVSNPYGRKSRISTTDSFEPKDHTYDEIPAFRKRSEDHHYSTPDINANIQRIRKESLPELPERSFLQARPSHRGSDPALVPPRKTSGELYMSFRASTSGGGLAVEPRQRGASATSTRGFLSKFTPIIGRFKKKKNGQSTSTPIEDEDKQMDWKSIVKPAELAMKFAFQDAKKSAGSLDALPTLQQSSAGYLVPSEIQGFPFKKPQEPPKHPISPLALGKHVSRIGRISNYAKESLKSTENQGFKNSKISSTTHHRGLTEDKNSSRCNVDSVASSSLSAIEPIQKKTVSSHSHSLQSSNTSSDQPEIVRQKNLHGDSIPSNPSIIVCTAEHGPELFDSTREEVHTNPMPLDGNTDSEHSKDLENIPTNQKESIWSPPKITIQDFSMQMDAPVVTDSPELNSSTCSYGSVFIGPSEI